MARYEQLAGVDPQTAVPSSPALDSSSPALLDLKSAWHMDSCSTRQGNDSSGSLNVKILDSVMAGLLIAKYWRAASVNNWCLVFGKLSSKNRCSSGSQPYLDVAVHVLLVAHVSCPNVGHLLTTLMLMHVADGL